MIYNGINISKRNDGRYQIVTNNKYIYGKSMDECFKNYIEFYQNENTLNSYNFEDWVNEWFCSYKSNNKQSSNDMIKSLIKNYVSKFFNYDINNIKSNLINKQINEIQNQGHLRQAQKLFILYNDIFDKAYKNQIININPCLAIKKPKYKAEEKNALTLKEEKALIDYINNSKYKNIILFCLYQGTRIGEALALKYNDIDFENKKISINKSKNAKNIVTSPKTEKSKRIIPLFDKTLNIIENKNTNDNIFNFNYDEIQKYLKNFSNASNIKITTHTLRHTFATRCIEKNINIKQVSKWLGHNSINITNNIYTHINDDFEEKQLQKINN